MYLSRFKSCLSKVFDELEFSKVYKDLFLLLKDEEFEVFSAVILTVTGPKES